MAISKKRKEELVAQYVEWLNQSQAMFVTEYTGLSMKQIDDLRAKVREVGGEFHIVKNTLGKVAFEQAGLELPRRISEGSTAIVFAFRGCPRNGKSDHRFARTSEFVKDQRRLPGQKLTSPPKRSKHWPNCRRCRSCAPSCWASSRRPPASWYAPWPSLHVRWLRCSRLMPKRHCTRCSIVEGNEPFDTFCNQVTTFFRIY